MDVKIDSLSSITQARYMEFKQKVQELLASYQEKDNARFNLVKKKIEQTNGNWDIVINLISGDSKESIDISQLLAYEYCLASERITHSKVSFESMLDKLFEGTQKFRIENPVLGMDDECLYGKSFDDETAMPVTSKLYRMVMRAGAQHLEYFKDGNLTGAVFIYEKGVIEGFAQDEKGNSVDMQTDGIDFSDLGQGQSLLTNLRQTVFHEWTHNSEKQIIEESDDSIEYEYKSEDGKTYRNYQKISSYVTSENIGDIKEPQYVISTQRDSQGNTKRYFRDASGNLRPLNEVKFELERRQLDSDICISTGLSTREVMPNGEIRMHNIITEGFVEETARAMIKAIEPQVIDIDYERYPEYVEIARRVISSRDISLGKDGKGQTYADFLMHSSVLKKDLESRTVVLDNGSKVDGLHYISDYANSVQNGRTRKIQFYRNMPNVASKLNLSKSQIEAVRYSKIWTKRELTDDDKNVLRTLLIGENHNNQVYVDTVVTDFDNILEEEAKFFNGIAAKLGYVDRSIEGKKTTQELGKETIEEQKDTILLDRIEQALTVQERISVNKRECK